MGRNPDVEWKDVNLVFLLNHTSLFEMVYTGILPVRFLWQLSGKLVYPVADITFDKLILGNMLKVLAPTVVRLTRKKDESWTYFLSQITDDSIVIFLPEGRMKRPNGLDKLGNPMTMKGGACEVLKRFEHSKLLIVYSGGLHHVMPPGKHIPRLFKRVKVAMEVIDVKTYCQRFALENDQLDKGASY